MYDQQSYNQYPMELSLAKYERYSLWKCSSKLYLILLEIEILRKTNNNCDKPFIKLLLACSLVDIVFRKYRNTFDQ